MNRTTQIQKGQMILMASALLCLFCAAPAFAGNVSASITDTGTKVGIGTTAPGTNIFGNGSQLWVHGNEAGLVLESRINGSGADTGSVQNRAGTTIGYWGANDVRFSVGSNTDIPVSIRANNTEVMRLTTAGNVGIGTANTSGKFSVAQGGAGWTGTFNNNNVGGSGVIIDAGNGTEQALRVRNYDGSREILSALGNGNVGIGTTWPGRLLEVNGGSTAAAAILAKSMANSGSAFFESNSKNASGTVQNWQIGANLALTSADFEIRDSTNGVSALTILKSTGNVGIGTTNPGAYKLAVKGKIHAEEVVVDTGWADFVFDKDYKLMPLEKVAQHINDNGHLPGVPTAQEVKEQGVSIGQMQSKLLEKIEEMTLYVIDLKKENDQLKERISSLENQAE